MVPQRIDFTETIVEAPPNLFHFLFFSYNKIQKRKSLLLPVLSTKMHRSSSLTNRLLHSIQFQNTKSIVNLMKSQEPKPLSISVTVLHHAASATKLLYFMKEKSFNSEVMKNSLPTATENIMNCGMHRRSIIQRKISKMPLAQIFFVRAGGISSTFNQNFLTQQKIHTRYKNHFHLVH